MKSGLLSIAMTTNSQLNLNNQTKYKKMKKNYIKARGQKSTKDKTGWEAIREAEIKKQLAEAKVVNGVYYIRNNDVVVRS